MCQHQPRCPEWPAPDRLAARIVADQPRQGWSLLCNGVIVFDDGGELLADGRAVVPDRRGLSHPAAIAALVSAMSQMSSVKAERALENRAHVRMLLRLRQPAFAAVLASAEQDFSCFVRSGRRPERDSECPATRAADALTPGRAG
jgi:hypothetical protein